MTELIKPDREIAKGDIVRKSPIWFRGARQEESHFGDPKTKRIVGYVVKEDDFKAGVLYKFSDLKGPHPISTHASASFPTLEAAKAWVEKKSEFRQ